MPRSLRAPAMAGSEVAPLACNSVITGARSAARAAAASALASAPFRAGLRGELGTRTKITQLLATTLGGSKRCLGAIRNKAGLEFGHESHLLQLKRRPCPQSEAVVYSVEVGKPAQARPITSTARKFRQLFASVGAGNPALTTIAVGAWPSVRAICNHHRDGRKGQRPINAGFADRQELTWPP
jgi:hypothetical protein